MKLTWVGHATILIETPGGKLITDPLLTQRVAHLRRRSGSTFPDVDDIDVVLLSHIHMDHVHTRSLRRISDHAHVVCPAGAAELIATARFADITEVEVGDCLTLGPFSITTVAAVHKAGRGPHSRASAQPVGYVIEAAGLRIYFAGDTDLFDSMSDLGPIDVAFLPIWGWGSTLGTGHLDPTRAAQATGMIEPEVVVPIHWGTYAPEDGRRQDPEWLRRPLEQFSRALDDCGHGARLHTLEPGASLSL